MRASLALLPLSACLAIFACTGSDPDVAPTSDERGAANQACFENGTCRGTLACVSGLCVVSGQPSADGAAGDSGRTDPVDAAPVDAGPPCARVGAVCDSFETYDANSLNAVWDWQDESGGGIFLDEGYVRPGGLKSLYAGIDATGTGDVSAVRTRTVPSNGAATWTTWVYLEDLPAAGSPQQLLALRYADSTKKIGAIALSLTSDGFVLDIENGTYVPLAGDLVKPISPGWNELRIDFDVRSNQVQAFVGGKTSDKLKGDNSPLVASGATVENVTLAVGLRTKFSGTKVDVWFDDLQFIPK